jgi:hypothetical protein
MVYCLENILLKDVKEDKMASLLVSIVETMPFL